MKTLALSILLLGIVLPSIVNAQGNRYVLSGKIGRVSAPAKAYLCMGDDIDSVVIHNGAFQFSGVIDEPKAAYLLINKRGTGIFAGQIGSMPYSLYLYIEPGKLSVKSPDSINNAVVQGGPMNADYTRIKAQLKDTDSALSRLTRDIMSAPPAISKSDSFGVFISRSLAAIGKDQTAIFLQFMKDNPHSLMSLYVLKCYGGF